MYAAVEALRLKFQEAVEEVRERRDALLCTLSLCDCVSVC